MLEIKNGKGLVHTSMVQQNIVIVFQEKKKKQNHEHDECP